MYTLGGYAVRRVSSGATPSIFLLNQCFFISSRVLVLFHDYLVFL